MKSEWYEISLQSIQNHYLTFYRHCDGRFKKGQLHHERESRRSQFKGVWKNGSKVGTVSCSFRRFLWTGPGMIYDWNLMICSYKWVSFLQNEFHADEFMKGMFSDSFIDIFEPFFAPLLNSYLHALEELQHPTDILESIVMWWNRSYFWSHKK